MKFVVEEVRVGKDNEFFVTMNRHRQFLTYLRTAYPLPDRANWVDGGMYWDYWTGHCRTFVISEAVWKVVSTDPHFKGIQVGTMPPNPNPRYDWSTIEVYKKVRGK